MSATYDCTCGHTYPAADRLPGGACPACGAVGGRSREELAALEPDTDPVAVVASEETAPQPRPRTEGAKQAARLMAKARRELADDEARHARMRRDGWLGAKPWFLLAVIVIGSFTMLGSSLMFILWLIAGRFHVPLAVVFLVALAAVTVANHRRKGEGM